MSGIIGLGVRSFASMAAVGHLLDTCLQIGMAVFLGGPAPLTLLFLSLLYSPHPTPTQLLPISTWCSQEGPFPETPRRVRKL